MKYRFSTLLIFSLFLLFLAGCAQKPKTITLVSEGQTKTITVKDGTDEYYADGKLNKALLVVPAVVRGYPVMDWLKLNPDGKLRYFKLSSDHEIHGIRIPAGSEVMSHNHPLETISLSKNLLINEVPCRGGVKIHTQFYPEGELRSCFLFEDARLGEKKVPCSSSLLSSAKFSKDGTLEECLLFDDFQVGEDTLEKGTVYRL